MAPKNNSTLSQTLTIIFWVCRLVFSTCPYLVIAVFLTQLVVIILPFAEQKYFSHLIDSLILALKSNSQNWIVILIIFFSLRLVRITFSHLHRTCQLVLDLKSQNELRKIYLNKTSALDHQQLEDKDIANLMAKVNEEYQWRSRQIIADIIDLIGNIIGFTTAIILLLPHYWLLALLLIIGEIPGMLVDRKWEKISWQTFNYYSEKTRPAWDVHAQLTSHKYLAELRINQAVDWIKSKFTRSIDEFLYARIKNRQDRFVWDWLTSFVSLTTTSICLLLVIKDIRIGLLTVGMFSFYFNIVRNTSDYFSSILNRFISINEQILYIANFKKILELSPTLVTGHLRRGIRSSPLIEFRHMSFKYPNTNRYIFKNFNLTIHPNEEIALVGINGAGKSTLIKLLCHFYDPQSGEILINGINLKKFDPTYWYQHLSLLTQEFNIYPNLLLKDNIIVGNPKIRSNLKVISALKKSEAYSFVKKYHRGLNAPLSQRYGGQEPSWGQWQKIAIARIFYRNTPIMILDEPTASIDALSEYKIFNRLYKTIKNKTLVIVSHRYSTVRNAQRIIVINNGCILEQGSHQQLLKLNGVYARSFSLQAQGYLRDTA